MLAQHDDHSDHKGFARDLDVMQKLLQRRQLLRLATGFGVAAFLGCKASETSLGSTAGTSGGDAGASGAAGSGNGGTCEVIPEETAGPYPGDGSNGVNALAMSGIIRSDIRATLGGTAVAGGVPLTVKLNLVDGACVALSGYAIYLWHCDREGRYSLYSSGVESESYLRGVQETDDEGRATFTTIFPGCYSGRWPHIHFEVFPGLNAATSHDQKVKTSQLALPQASCTEAYATAGYETSVRNLASANLERDNVFSDGVTLQLATIEGDARTGYTATLTVAVDA